MKRLMMPVLACALIGVLAVWWFSPEQVLKRRTGSLLETLTFEQGSGRASRQMGVYSLTALLADDVELETPTIDHANGTFERADLESAYGWLCGQARQMHFEVREIHSVDVDDDRGVVVFSVNALVELPTYRPADGNYHVTFDWQHTEDEWRLVRATWLEEGL